MLPNDILFPDFGPYQDQNCSNPVDLLLRKSGYFLTTNKFSSVNHSQRKTFPVESLVSRYKTHFDKKRQLKEEYALEEMEIAENGPELVHADKILVSAMGKYWQEMSKEGVWHFCHKTSDIRTYTKSSKVVEKFLKSKPKFPFMND